MSLTSLLQEEKVERVRCGKTEQLFTLPSRSYQIAFLSCQQNKLTPNRRTLAALCQGDRHILIQKKENKAAATRPNNILHFASKYHCSSSGLKVSFITLLQAEKSVFQRSFPKLSIKSQNTWIFFRKAPRLWMQSPSKQSLDRISIYQASLQHLCIEKLQHPHQLKFYVPVLLAGAWCGQVLSSRK